MVPLNKNSLDSWMACLSPKSFTVHFLMKISKMQTTNLNGFDVLTLIVGPLKILDCFSFPVNSEPFCTILMESTWLNHIISLYFDWHIFDPIQVWSLFLGDLDRVPQCSNFRITNRATSVWTLRKRFYTPKLTIWLLWKESSDPFQFSYWIYGYLFICNILMIFQLWNWNQHYNVEASKVYAICVCSI